MRSLCLTLALIGALSAQDPPSGDFTSTDPAKQAWAAELAARNGSQESVPDLIKLLHGKDHRVQEQALDALIRLKATVSPDELKALPPQFGEQVIVLAIANKQTDFLLSMLQQNPPYGADWVALNEALANSGGGKAYWSSLLRDWTIHVAIYVVEPRHPARISRLGGSAGCGDYIQEDRPGFPPQAIYTLSLSARLGGTVLISHPHPVYVRRSNPSECGTPIDRNDFRADFITAAVHETPWIEGHMRFEFDWTSQSAYLADMKKQRASVLGAYRQIIDWLTTRDLLYPDDPARKPKIVVRIEDQRADKSHPLPPTPPWE